MRCAGRSNPFRPKATSAGRNPPAPWSTASGTTSKSRRAARAESRFHVTASAPGSPSPPEAARLPRRRADDRPAAGTEQSPGRRRGSLRAELLFNLSFLAVAALLLALWTATLLRTVGPRPSWTMLLLLVLDVTVFVLLGRYLIDRLVVVPLRATVVTAEAIAGGDYARRAAAGDT